MQSTTVARSRWLGVVAVIAVVFGVLTVVAGGRTLFDEEVRQQAGNFVAFVLWFNFLAGFVYIVAGIGLWFGQRWSVWLSIAITAATLFVGAAFAFQIWRGSAYEMRTVAAMAVRALTWLAISIAAKVMLAPKRGRIDKAIPQ